MIKVAAAAAAVLLLAGCTTTVKERPTAEVPARQHYVVQSVKGASSVPVPSNVIPRLERVIQAELAGHPSSGPPANLEFLITEYRVRSAQARALAGMLVGADHVRATVTLRSPEGAVLRQFEVNRVANPGGLGALMDQEEGAAKAAAKSIAELLAR
jgi:hypothetical protein